MTEKPNLAASFTVLALYGAVSAGFAGLVVGIFAFFDRDWVGAGVSIGAAALAFGLVANALVRR